MANWTLYHTEGCHLCEQAHELIVPILHAGDSMQLVDIMSNDELICAYQTSIPVLKSDNGQALFWPFTAQQVRQLFSQTV